jgi:methionine-rich copper-binding protein CopC
MRSRRLAAGLALGMGLALAPIVVGMPAASGHSAVIGTEPADGAVLESAPATVTVMFDSGLIDVGTALVVRVDDSLIVSSPQPTFGRRSLSTAIAADAPPGRYTAAFRVVSEDGHTITDSFSFTVTGANSVPPTSTSASTSPSPTGSVAPAQTVPASPDASTPTGDGGSWPILVGLAVLVAVAVAVVIAVVRRPRA